VNWLDVAIVALILVCVIWGGKTGLFNTALYGIGLLISWSLSGYASLLVAHIFESNASLSTIVSTLCYVIVLGSSIVVVRAVTKLIRPATFIIDVITVGMNRVGGLFIGLIIGILATSILICGLARFTYDLNLSFDLPSSKIDSVQVSNKIENTRDFSETALMDSKSATVFITVLTTLPSNVFQIVPSQYMAPLIILDHKGQN
jgi:uncharacterized membrane protein required for colicin V production